MDAMILWSKEIDLKYLVILFLRMQIMEYALQINEVIINQVINNCSNIFFRKDWTKFNSQIIFQKYFVVVYILWWIKTIFELPLHNTQKLQYP